MNPALEPRLSLRPDLLEEAVSLTVDATLVAGTLALPTPARDLGVVLAHGWSGYRSGPHGLLTALARDLAGAGYPTLRFDFRGRGESGGDGLATSLVTMADDLVAASQWLLRRPGVRRLVYVGLCSGGNVTIGALPRLPPAAGLVLFSVYPFSDGDAFGRDVHRTWHYARVYLQKGLRLETWRRLVQGEVHLTQVLNVLFGHFGRRRRNRQKEEGAPNPAPARTPGQTARASRTESRTQTGEPPRKHLANLGPSIPTLMLYGTADPDAPGAVKYFGDYARQQHLPVEFAHLEGANHNFSSVAWRHELTRQTLAFVQRLG